MPTTTAARESRATSRDRFGEAWRRLPALLAALGRAPGDTAARFQLAATFGSLGLPTAAEAQLGRLAGAAQREGGVVQLRSALRQLPAEEIPPAKRQEVCRANLEVLRRRGLDLSGHLRQWEQRHDPERWFAALDGNIVRCRGGLDEPGGWRGIGDLRGNAERFAAEQFPAARMDYTPPIIVEGLDPPWLAQAMHERTAEAFNGYTPRIRIVHRDVAGLLDGLAAVDLETMLGDERVEVFAGEDAGRQLRAALTQQADFAIAGPCITNPGAGRRIDPAPHAVAKEVAGLQQRRQAELTAEVDRLYEKRDRAWWAQRYAAALAPGTVQPLRVLVLSCRFSTYVRHANEDLVAALNGAGCETRQVIEPDDHSRLMATPYLRAVRDFRPDLVVLVNYLRSSVAGMIPPQVPLLSWLQDSMPHLFDGETWRQQTELDYLAGHMASLYFGEFGFPERRALRFPMIASERKFHSAAITGAHRRRFECEIAFATRHSETPRQLHERLVQQLAQPDAFNRLLEELYEGIGSILNRWPVWGYAQEINDAIEALFAGYFGRKPDDRFVTTLGVTYATPVADRMLRHQTLHWAADLAERNGWRLHLYGRGWEAHERFGPYARGELSHGDALRAAYQAAATHLHVCAATLLHQRILECALSGGLPLCRLKPDDLLRVGYRLFWRLNTEHTPDAELESGHAMYEPANHAPLMRWIAQRHRLGLPFDERGELYVAKAFRCQYTPAEAPGPSEQDEEWPLLDLADTTFRSRDELEGLVGRALERPAWRRAISVAMAGRIRRRYTTRAFAERLVAHIRDDLQRAD